MAAIIMFLAAPETHTVCVCVYSLGWQLFKAAFGHVRGKSQQLANTGENDQWAELAKRDLKLFAVAATCIIEQLLHI